jgi:rhodanese-related sulfurtransferase
MIHFRRNIWIKASKQVLFIILIVLLAGFASNMLRPDRIPFFEDWSKKPNIVTPSGENLEIPLSEAEGLFKKGFVTFIDARPRTEYEAGHIKGAKSLPFKEADWKFIEVMTEVPEENAVITYCDGEACELSIDLALFLKNAGYKNVRVLLNGWTVWRQKGLPVETGAQ